MAAEFVDSAAITHMGTDTERIVSNLRNSIHEIWATVIEVGVAVWLLEKQINVSCVVPAVIAIGSVLAAAPLSSRMGQAQGQWVERVQSRVSMTSNMLRDIKSVKMLGLSGVMYTAITKLRQAELETSKRFRNFLIVEIALHCDWPIVTCTNLPPLDIANVPSTFAPFATLTVCGIIAGLSKDETLLSSQAFTSLSLITLVTSPLLKFIQSVPSLKEAMACFDRIEGYCLKPIVPPRETGILSSESDEDAIELVLSPPKSKNGVAIAFNNARRNRYNHGTSRLRKSTLLQTILQETVVQAGEVKVTTSESQTAYCVHVPWILNSSVREKITLGSEFNSEWYEFSTSVCGLKADLQKMPSGDSFQAGSDGVSLSGGQKQRIALCRAIYSRAKLVVLDDVFSGVDTHNVSLISNGLFGQRGYFRSAGITVLLVTHTGEFRFLSTLNEAIANIISEPLLQYADEIIVLEDGKIVYAGSYEAITRREPDISAKALTNTHQAIEDDVVAERENENEKKAPDTAPPSSPLVTLQCWTSLETCIGAVARVQQFTQTTPCDEENDLVDSHLIGSSVYSDNQYTISFQKLTAGYEYVAKFSFSHEVVILTILPRSLSSPPVLKDISLTFAPGEKIAICGTSGSGKTSLIMSILRMNQIHSGNLRIKGRDLVGFTHQGIHALVNVIPQDPLIISPGTVRFNIDPLNLASDTDIKTALQKVGLWDRINARGSDNSCQDETGTETVLDTDLSTASTNWSVGEKQLLALARPLAVPKPILILDEATSSLDGDRKLSMQQLIEKEFAEQTILAVVHRFKFIHLFDRVAFMKDGVLVECDKPEVLLERDT
ncbi:ATP-binding cassette transporter [Penicillium malachiteum]|nr:ATP-binding cassette transporter [Penicillium malachiteum]